MEKTNTFPLHDNLPSSSSSSSNGSENNLASGSRASQINREELPSDNEQAPPIPPHRRGEKRDGVPDEPLPLHAPLSRTGDPPQEPAVSAVSTTTNGDSRKKAPHRRAHSTASSLNAPPRITVNRTATITRLPSIPERTFRYQRIESDDPLPVSFHMLSCVSLQVAVQ